MAKDRIHFPAERTIEHQTMLICINAAEEAPCLLIVPSDRATRSLI
jgi:hypothetical protein